jgi:RND family efflux transporter MFP subunit
MKTKLIPVLLCLVLLTGCNTKAVKLYNENQELVRTVKTETVSSKGYSETLVLSGNIIPTQTVKVSFKIPGVVSKVEVSEGEFVRVGQKIATMDTLDYGIKVKGAQAQKAAAQAQEKTAIAQRDAAQAQIDTAQLQIDTEIPSKIEQAKAQYDLTQISYARVKAMYEKEAVAKSQLDEIYAKLKVDENTYQQALDAKKIAETEIKAAKSQLEAANAQIMMATSQTSAMDAQLDAAHINLEDAILMSPIEGVVLEKVVQSGEITNAGYPIVAIGEINKVWAEIGVTDDVINKLHKGQAAKIYIYGLNAYFDGAIDEINAVSDIKTRTFPVKILIDNAQNKLKPGMICKAEVSTSSTETVLVPISSVIHFSEGPAMYLLNADHTVSKRKVEIGEIIGDRIQVISGLKKDDTIVVEGQLNLHDGDKVELKEMTK